jgi:hypothetical protein
VNGLGIVGKADSFPDSCLAIIASRAAQPLTIPVGPRIVGYF